MRNLTLLFVLVFLFKTTSAQKLNPLPTAIQKIANTDVFPKNAASNYVFKDGNSNASPSVIKVLSNTNNQPVFEVEVIKALSSHYGVQLSWKNSSSIKKGDVLLARFMMKAIYAKQESGDGEVNFYVQDGKNFEKSIMLALGAGPEWKEYNIPFIAQQDLPLGSATICLSFGALAQKIQLKDITVLNFAKSIKKVELPETKFTYTGRDNNALWRKEALNRIDEIRKTPILIKVVDKNGNPIQGAKVSINMVKSDFMFGTEVNADLLCQDNPQVDIYKSKITQLFNTVTIGNGLKWGQWIDSKRRDCTKEAIDWISAKNLNLRGHNLVWPGKKFTPTEFKTKTSFVDGLNDSITNHIKNIANYTKGKVVAWDVVNEMVHEKDYFNVMPRTNVADWYKLAKQIDPNAQLFLNEYGMLNSVSSPATIKTFIALIEELKSYGAPIDAVGIQGHVGRQPRDPVSVLTDLDVMANVNLPIQITEFDINMPDEELQADYTRDFLIACFSHPAVTGFTMWGFWQGSHWKPDAAMFRKDWSPKPNAKVWEDLVTKQWVTNEEKATSGNGEITTTVFNGNYKITLKLEGKTQKISFSHFDKINKEVTIIAEN
ncbi:endo-1,4-beta-xylanase [Pedobacter psychrophilus]|nr:endo-1,4-beta-xylanase [Pedobacter psychrophilus]